MEEGQGKKETAFSVSFERNELKELTEAAKMHGMSRTRFIKNACLAYVHKRYLVPDTESMRAIASALTLHHSALLEVFETDKVPQEVAIELLYRMELLEGSVLDLLTHPKYMSGDS